MWRPRLDPTSRRLLVRADDRQSGARLLKPEMYANVGIFTEQDLAGRRRPARGAHL